MKRRYIYIAMLVLLSLGIIFINIKSSSEKANSQISKAISDIINMENQKQSIISSDDEAKLIEFIEKLKEKGYTDIKISEYMPEEENIVYLLAQAKNSADEEIEKGIFYITVTLTEQKEVQDLIVSSVVNIRKNKDNF
ncbi:hypothetical protein J2Z35_001565 [Acetoanaerobium pronyense]|uniref:Uncharacterized protein n=1 Tax=Acetoanaerobium pronyense TaxID=1482736 RepID=A0ABS4KJ11_9FIRM|nr:hypothetical protein [Acetoanaerobium pronyense]MBP2027767.1 hypothetical protein [Acetoanaerobium pronyense]